MKKLYLDEACTSDFMDSSHECYLYGIDVLQINTNY